MSYARPEDVAARLGRSLSDDEVGQVQAFLDDAEIILRSRIADLLDRAAASDTYEALVILVESKAARRVMLNPGGIRQHAESVDDYSQSDTFDTAISSSDTYITDDEWALLGVTASTGGSGSFSMARGYW